MKIYVGIYAILAEETIQHGKLVAVRTALVKAINPFSFILPKTKLGIEEYCLQPRPVHQPMRHFTHVIEEDVDVDSKGSTKTCQTQS
jgi:hypothetical protein